ncbi:MAG: hypothetical protein ACTSQP_22515 [Promethearchaeota archaeon]
MLHDGIRKENFHQKPPFKILELVLLAEILQKDYHPDLLPITAPLNKKMPLFILTKLIYKDSHLWLKSVVLALIDNEEIFSVTDCF